MFLVGIIPKAFGFLLIIVLYLYFYIIFDQRRVDIIDQVEYGVHGRLHIYPLCDIFYFPW